MLKEKIEKELQDEANISIVTLVDRLIEYALKSRSSDIHIDPAENDLRVRFRVDGVLYDAFSFPKSIKSEVVSRIKVLSGLRTDEHQTAQDGRFRINFDGSNPLDIRVSIVPTYYGENATLRLLADQTEELTLENMGFNSVDRAKVLRAAKRPYGMILATGPTGSGKTTSLYALLRMLHTKDVSIITIEDPVEYAVHGVNQIQVNQRSGMTFANGLRSILRQDPDIIMVGEIRDSETANIAVNTSLTGHLLLSTLHTNDAATTLPRLLDMGIEPYLVASTVNVVIGQRLVRKICSGCKTKKTLTENEVNSLKGAFPARLLGADNVFYHGAGCDKCNGSGYKGRMGIFEVLEVDPDIRDAFLRKESAAEIKRIAVGKGMTPMAEDGFAKAKAGFTTVEDVLRVVSE
ncbi:MAG: type II/IV secretion system protein [Candidatus Yanofskybacteria bacterium]|nr:type II/IV secretion system protein [Candidatus Yanofskybacteria bacterium]